MYTPEHFRETDPAEIKALIAAHPLAALVAQTSDGLTANHIPLIAEGEKKLIGHIALNNDTHRQITNGSSVLAIFGGESSYISPNWYPTKAEDHKSVPSWNYQVVHVHGTIRFSHEEKAKRRIVGSLTTLFERSLNGDDAWRMADAPADYMDGKLADIVGLEITIERIEAKSKLSQNRAPVDRAKVLDMMEKTGKHALAARMSKADR